MFLYTGPKDLLIYILKDQVEAIAFCPFIFSNETKNSKYIFYAKNKKKHQIPNIVSHGATHLTPSCLLFLYLPIVCGLLAMIFCFFHFFFPSIRWICSFSVVRSDKAWWERRGRYRRGGNVQKTEFKDVLVVSVHLIIFNLHKFELLHTFSFHVGGGINTGDKNKNIAINTDSFSLMEKCKICIINPQKS